MKTIILTIFIFMVSIQISNAQWVQVPNGMGSIWTSSLAVSGSNIFAGTAPNSGVYISTNNGLSWTQTSLNNQDIRSIAVSGNNIYAGSYSGNGVYKSTDNGTTWTQTSLNNQTIRALAVSGNNVYAGSFSGNGVYKSTDNGTSWTQTSLNNQNVRSMAANGNNVYVGNGDNPSWSGVYLSTDNGTSWTQTSLNNIFVGSLAVNGNYIFAGSGSTNSGVYKSTNNGLSWTQISLNSSYVYSLYINGNNIFAGTYNNGVYVSTDNGATYAARNEGFPAGSGNQVNSLCILNNYIFAGSGNAGNMGVFRRPVGELTGLQSISSEMPNEFSLSQNYPNPFNPTTKIKFALPNNSFAKLVVYDALGRELETLVNEQLNAGTYEAVWSADKYSSGVYFYTLTSGAFSQTNRMLMIK